MTEFPLPSGRHTARPLLLLCLSYAMLVSAWAAANPPFAAPDEWAHHMRAIGVGRGAVIGERAAWPIPPGASELRVIQTTWANQALRSVTVPPRSSPAGLDCNAFRPHQSAACLDRLPVAPDERVQHTPVGTYQPMPYVLPGLAIRLADGPQAANRLARFASALPCLLLLFAAACVASDAGRTPAALLGLMVAATPMVVFIVSTLNGSGLETAAGIGFAAALGRLGRSGDASRLAWVVAGVAGATLALSRSTGAVWVVLLLATFLAAGAIDSFKRNFRRHAPAAVLALIAIAAAITANRWWEAAYGPPVTPRLGPWPGSVRDAIDLVREVVRQEIGMFGTLDAPMPRLAYQAWLGMTLVVVVVAAAVGTWRERLVLLGAVVAFGVALPIALQAAILVHTGFQVQGRHVLPVVAVIPIIAAEILVRRELRLGGSPATRLIPPCALVAGSVQLAGWYWSARRQSVGVDGDFWFALAPEWSPPLGWWPWLLLAIAGAATLASSGIAAAGAARRAR